MLCDKNDNYLEVDVPKIQITLTHFFMYKHFCNRKKKKKKKSSAMYSSRRNGFFFDIKLKILSKFPALSSQYHVYHSVSLCIVCIHIKLKEYYGP